MRWRRRATGERAEAGHRTLSKVVRIGTGAVAPSLATHAIHLGHLVRLLLSVEHHLLVGPLGELSVSWVVVLSLGVQLALCGVAVDLVGWRPQRRATDSVAVC